ncbi:hypothetical protein Ped0055_02750 [Pediococcus pentosaceus]|uniref:hypothetical protein n=1 Tax=Pediococcus pentosaceus TaxID=1255 RepID=UPI0006D8BE54|nr:hypothetical protein [Pediococcus pentosaceus]KQB82263.1 hypothetical protein AN278_02105 [Pediococcus pentosaceus]UQA99516.1 hypothetical protein Ped0055_02750 [Pediococcus pentosaceus]
MNRIEQVKQLIPHGSDNPITAKEIKHITGIPLREIYGIVRYLLIHENIPIGAYREGKNSGYFIITNEEERKATLMPLISHAKEIEKRINVIKHINLNSEVI